MSDHFDLGLKELQREVQPGPLTPYKIYSHEFLYCTTHFEFREPCGFFYSTLRFHSQKPLRDWSKLLGSYLIPKVESLCRFLQKSSWHSIADRHGLSCHRRHLSAR
jgi:hypothetical protein